MITSVVENTKYSEATASPLHFARFEFKYILSAAKRQAVETDLLYFLEYDPFVANRPDHKYFVRSLYFDDPAYSSFHDKIDGLMSRYKFRVELIPVHRRRTSLFSWKSKADTIILSSSTGLPLSQRMPRERY